MRLEDLKHLPVTRGPLTGDREIDLPLVPVELADVEFNRCGVFRPIYVRGIQVPDGSPDIPYLVWANHIKVQTGERDSTLKTKLIEITNYRTQVKHNPFS